MSVYQPKSYNNRASIAKTVSTQIGASYQIESIASGLLQPGNYMPENDGQYAQFRRYLHDVLCLSLIDSGHFHGYELKLSDLGIITNNKRLNQQKPDLYTVNGADVHIGELTATYSPELASTGKVERYKEYKAAMEESGYVVTLSILIIDLSNPEWNLSFPPISSLFMQIIDDMLTSLRFIHANPKFGALRKRETGFYSIDRFQFKLEDKTIKRLVFEATGVDMDPSKSKLRMEGLSNLSDEEYIDAIAGSIISKPWHTRPKPSPESIVPEVLLADIKKLKSANTTTTKLPRVLQLGSPTQVVELELTYNEVIQSLRDCNKSGGYLGYILSSLQNENPLDDHLITLAISQHQLEEEQKSGPGRKNYYKKHGIKAPREPPVHIGVKDSHVKLVETFMADLSSKIRVRNVKELRTQDILETGLSAYNTINDVESIMRGSVATSLLTFYQKISNEIVLNSMRRRKTRQYALGYSGIKGIYFLVAPGPQLRTESNVEFVKIISFVPGITNGLSTPWHDVDDHWESDWLSVDTDRLKHWQRSQDRVYISTVTNAERLVRPGINLTQALNEEVKLGNHLLMALVFLENKQTTSTTNQTLRYLWMKSIGDKQFQGIVSKFPTRVNSVLQSFMMTRSFETCIELCQQNLADLVNVGKTVRDEETGHYDESTTGVINLMPRLFTFGSPVPISYNLNEIYWCMMYNKDRQNTTQDSMSILTKILKEEQKFDSEIDSRSNNTERVNYLFGTTTLQSDINHIHSEKPESHYYSSKAVHCGIRLQDNHQENSGDGGSWLNSVKLDAILSKNLSEFATFKASVKTICDQINLDDLQEIKKIGNRTKAIELVAEIVKDENLITAAEVAMTFSGDLNDLFRIYIQIFKKNQIGGVREIIILFIKARILFNIVEEIARLLSKSDKREILTKGKDKRLMMRGDYEDVMTSFPKGTPLRIVKESYDMTTWAQKFIPTIFIPLYEHHFKSFPGLRDLSRFIFLNHTNKRMEFPRKLVEQWMLHPEMKHEEVGVQKAKETFLKTGKPWFTNHSNMCQGIPHYNSTVLALSCLSLRDSLFFSCLRQLGKEKTISWKTRVGSDDKGTIIAMDMTKRDSYYQYLLLGQCERASERLHSMELSVKSASGHVMYELNSAFMANLETLSPTIKFSLAAVDTIGTTSCTSFVNESFGRIRQLRENGASSIVCSLAHSLNARHFYQIFATDRGMTNDLTDIFKTQKSNIPYDFGVYPMYDIDLQDVIGPEYYNYLLVKNQPESPIVKLLYTEISRDELTELFPTDETPLLKKDHFGINQGLVRQLVNMRKRLDADPIKIDDFLSNNPFMIVRGPETQQETLNTILAKLFTKGASESLRRTSPAIYIGRLSAFRSSESWTSPFQNQECYNIDTMEVEHREVFTKSTYRDFLQQSLDKARTSEINLSLLLTVLYPQHSSFDIVSTFVGQFGATKSTDKKYSQAVRTWTVNNFNYEYTSTLKSILETSFGTSQQSSYEDVAEFKKLTGMELNSLSGLVEDCKSRGIRPLDMFFYMTKLHKSSRTSRIQTFANGPSTAGLHMTALSLKRYNHIPGAEVMLDAGIDENQIEIENSISQKLDRIKFYYNLLIMQKGDLLQLQSDHIDATLKTGVSLSEDCKTTIRSIRSLSGFDTTTQKTLKLVACELLMGEELREKLVKWRSLNYSYITRQRKNITKTGNTQWSGDLSVLVSSDTECYTITESSGNRYVETREVNDLGSLFRSMRDMCKTLGMEMNSFFTRKPASPGDIYLSPSSKMLHRCETNTPLSIVLKIRINPRFRFRRLADLVSFSIKTDYNKKTGEIQVYLADQYGRTATICHSNGNYYPVDVPPGLNLGDDISYLGVRLSKLLENRSWFYNFRLPSMSHEDCVKFISNDVDLNKVMSLEKQDVRKIKEYIEVREEVNEESFSLMRDYTSNQKMLMSLTEEDEQLNFNELFRKAMDQTEMPESLTNFSGDIGDWADQVEEENMNEMDKLNSALDDEENIGMVRAFGYKKPAPRRAMATISGLQQGGVLKRRVLDAFFNSQNVRNEQPRQLPHMYLWLNTVKDHHLQSTVQSLREHILIALSATTGLDPPRVKVMLDNQTGQYLIPIAIFHSVLEGDTEAPVDLMEQLLTEAGNEDDEYYPESDLSDGEYQ